MEEEYRILVTGADGQLGSELRRLLGDRALYAGRSVLDLTDADAVGAFVRKHRFAYVVNCAAYTAVDKAEDNQELCRKLNEEAPGILARAAQANGAAMIQISTDYVFDGTAHVPYTEECEIVS